MEGDPFAVVEAMAIEAFAVGAGKAYLYIRGEYPLAEARIANAITAATEAGLLDGLDIELRRGAGAYICGEETALFESIEGKRGEPRNKPPFPVEVGLFDKPTAVNNVETIVNVLLIVREDGGAEAFKAIGTEGSTGPKLFCLSGNVERPGRTRSRSGRRSASCSPSAAASPAVARSRRSCSVEPPACSSDPKRSTCRSPSRPRAPPGRRSARAW